jgi:hypothetical protein
MHLVLQDELLGLVTAVSGLACSSSTMNFMAPPKSPLCRQAHLETVDHIDLGENAGGRRHISDAQFFGRF